MTAPEDQFGLPNDTHQWQFDVCEWKITVEADAVVQLTIDTLDAVYYSKANYLLVLDVQSGQEDTLARLHFHDQPWLIRSHSSSMVVRLVLGDGGLSTGLVFNAHYKAIRADQVRRECGGNVTGSSGEIVSPKYPENYDNFLDCQWLITVNSSLQIFLDFFIFDLEEDCRNDSLQIRDGNNMTAPQLLPPSCGNKTHTVQTLTSSNNVVLVKFVTDEQVTASGFNATWTAVTRTCGGNQTGSGGVLQSPLYPGNYPNNASCSWVLTARRGHSVRLTFRHFDLEDSTDCTADFVEVSDLKASWRRRVRLCGDGIPLDVRSTGTELYVQFVSNADVSATGFSAEWLSVFAVDGFSVECRRDVVAASAAMETYTQSSSADVILVVSRGLICEKSFFDPRGIFSYSSSSFDLAEGEKSECTYQIALREEGYKVHLYITNFYVGGVSPGSSCPGIYIEIADLYRRTTPAARLSPVEQ
ncbi:tolloid-like protein 2 [Babylonia areolata]|uniref:tolloid-like protein 2 n=1 Tax=Babylonia areolata TaxID=304850 RepID=UPI003FD21828